MRLGIRRRCASPNTIMWSRLCLLKASRPVKLSDFRRVYVRNRKILRQMKFLRRRRRRFRLSATREDRDPARAQRRLWRLMASKTEETPQKEEMPEKEGPETLPDSPLLGLSGGAVRELVRSAKKRGYVTHDQINSVLPSEQVNSEQIEDVLAMFSEMGLKVVETEETSQEGEKPREEADEEAESESGELVEVQQKVPAKSEAKEPTERTDDPVRMYLREMGSVELLSREGEIAIAKRIEVGREAMIAGLCESPLTFQAIIIWRDELNEGKVFLRDIIDLEATYAGPDAKAMPAPVIGPDGQPIVAVLGAPPVPGSPVLAQTPAPPAAPTGATRANGEDGEGGEVAPGEGDFDDDDMENSLSLAAIEGRAQAQGGRDLRQRCRRLQAAAPPAGPGQPEQAAQRFALARPGAPLQEAQGRHHQRGEVVTAQSGAHRRAGRAALRHQQAPGRLRRPPDAARRGSRRRARGFPQELPGLRARSALAQSGVEAFRQGLEEPRRPRQGEGQAAPPRDPGARGRDRARDRRVPQDRADGAEGRARGASGQEGDGGGEPAPRYLDCKEIHQSRLAVPRPDPGRQYRPDEGGRQIRVSPRLQVLDLCHLVDPAGDHALDRRPGAHHPHPRAYDGCNLQGRTYEPAVAQRDRPRAHARGACREARHAAREGAQGAQDRQGAVVTGNPHWR